MSAGFFDQGVPEPLRKLLPAHQVITAYERGWSASKNGELMTAIERNGFDVFVTTDQNLRHRQNLATSTLMWQTLSTRRCAEVLSKS